MTKLNYKYFFTLALTVTLYFAAACTHGQLLYKPGDIKVPTSMSNQAVGKVIKETLIKRRWAITGDKPGEVLAHVRVPGGHGASIKVTYDNRKINIQYVDSQNLSYRKEGNEERIHNRYNLWIQNLEHDLEVALSAKAV